MIDREWMYNRVNGNFLSSTYAEKVDEFIEFSCKQENVMIDGLLKCPCAKCRNVPYLDPDVVKFHLYQNGFRPNYHKWTFHGEDDFDNEIPTSGFTTVGETSNPYKSMVLDAFRHDHHLELAFEESIDVEEPLPEYKKFFDMLKAAEEPLYDGCKLSLLSVAARITNLKCEYNMPNKAIDDVASLVKEICPEINYMTDTFSRTRKLLDGLELPHHRIDVCPNGCMLFWKEHKDLNECLICKANRYKTSRSKSKRSLRKVLFYLPIAPRLQRLYATKSTAEQMRWHAENPRVEGVMSHPSDGEAWKHFDESFPSFAEEPQNVRLGLCTDGFSPFGKSGKQYSCWPVMLTPYNLPPGLCMKKPFTFLSLIIPGPKSPKGNLDVFLQPLIDELKMLWELGVPTYDVSKKQNFQMRAMLHWTISDFPAYGMLSGWSTAGKLACPYCMEHTKAFTLTNA
ncbi:uncharacterized protein [Spinacia oleracea]|uniref:Uncharacterized protein isoform X2 n=1 Tax=Spinacia oleracea TaxID=3562 RepID=A0A9R0KDM0_SPIOL|nr:uncharacterized protein LOC110805968 isoform X2 [Spinacia oleracea]